MKSLKRQSTAKIKRLSASARERAKNKKIALYFIGFILLVVAFSLGFAIRSNEAIVSTLGLGDDNTVNSASATSKTKTTYDALSERIGEVEDILTTFSMESIDLQEATRQMLSELMTSTGDPYAQYFTSDRYETYIKETSSKKYSGIGVLFGDYNGRAYVIDVLEGSEAQARGVSQGDFVQAIDGDSSHKWSIVETIGSLDREDGDSVIITWMRPISIDADRGSEFTTTLTCRNYTQENVTTSLEESVGYVKVQQFTNNASDLIEEAVTALVEAGATSFVIDVRDNPGGYLTQAVDAAGLFVQSGVLVGIETNEGVSTRTSSGNVITDLPIVVLTNNYTCAAAEVFVAALQDNQVATTVGQTTMGKGSVQVMRELSFGGAVRYTAAYYLTPLGHEINGVGVLPNIAVADDPDDETDNQLVVALDVARSLTS